MRPLLGIFVTIILGLSALACGGADKNTAARQEPTATTATGQQTITTNYSTHNNDRDNDGDHNDDDEGVLKYGQAASPSDRRISDELVKRYFAAASAEDGAGACELLVHFIAEAVPETEGRAPSLRGNTCADVLTKLFKQEHRLIATKNRSLKVIGVRVEGNKALAIVDFAAIPEVRQMNERRVGHTWRLLELHDGNLE
jgi:hypothetical protein